MIIKHGHSNSINLKKFQLGYYDKNLYTKLENDSIIPIFDKRKITEKLLSNMAMADFDFLANTYIQTADFGTGKFIPNPLSNIPSTTTITGNNGLFVNTPNITNWSNYPPHIYNQGVYAGTLKVTNKNNIDLFYIILGILNIQNNLWQPFLSFLSIKPQLNLKLDMNDQSFPQDEGITSITFNSITTPTLNNSVQTLTKLINGPPWTPKRYSRFNRTIKYNIKISDFGTDFEDDFYIIYDPCLNNNINLDVDPPTVNLNANGITLARSTYKLKASFRYDLGYDISSSQTSNLINLKFR